MNRAIAVPGPLRAVSLLVCAVLGSSASLSAQTFWSTRDAPSARTGHAAAADTARGRVVVFGGTGAATGGVGDTWEWDGDRWFLCNPATSPSARSEHAMVYDPAHGVTLLFGGFDGTNQLADTWVWNGTNWTRLFPANSPSPRQGHALAYDSSRGVAVLFGGTGPALGGLTWEWDGTDWTQRAPAASPSGRDGHAMAYDAARGRVLLFGGHFPVPSQPLSDTWEWDGTNWTQRHPPQFPSSRYGSAMAFDAARGRIVLFGGYYAGGSLQGDTWEWDGATWLPRSPATNPPARRDHVLAFDALRNRTVLFGGAATADLADTWEWDGTDWTLRRLGLRPAQRSMSAMAYDLQRQHTVLFGGMGAGNVAFVDTWAWDGANWSQLSPAASPSARGGHAMAYDSARGVTVLFGGVDYSHPQFLGETWEWDGVTWVQRSTFPRPASRMSHAMAYDSARGVTVLFGGLDYNSPSPQPWMNDTWEWDGSAWRNLNPATSPFARHEHAMAYDPVRARTVLFGGAGSGTYFNGDTWEWDGITWTQRLGAGPPGRHRHAMAADVLRGRVVLFGGVVSGVTGIPTADTWEWDGTQWLQRTSTPRPPVRAFPAMAFDPVHGRTVLFGGNIGIDNFGNNQTNATWEYEPLHPAAVLPFGSGCPGSAGTPTLGADAGSLPWLGETFTARLAGLGADPLANLPFLLLGDSSTQSGSFTLPLDLAFLGMPGCSLFTSLSVSFTLSNQGGSATCPVLLPPNPSYAGLSIYAQGAVTDPGANALGLIWSNACELRLGAK